MLSLKNSTRKLYSVVHPGTQHSHHTAFALQQAGKLERLYTSVFIVKDSFVARVLKLFLGDSYERVLSSRSFDLLDKQKVFSFPFFELLEKVLNLVLRNGGKNSPWADRAFASYATMYLPKNAFATICYPGAAGPVFKYCARKKIMRILDMPTAHHRFQMQIIEEERKLQPEWAASLYHSLDQDRFAQLDYEIDFADLIVVPSDFVRRTLINTGVKDDKIVKIPYGCYFEPIQQDNLILYKSQQPLRIVFVGQIQQKKGIVYLLEAAKKLKQCGIAYELSVVGKIYSCEAVLQKYQDYFTHIPFMPRSQLRDFLTHQHVLVLPSLFEGSSLSVLEAQAAGLTCIVTEHSGCESVLPGNGFVIPIRDSQSIFNSILSLSANADLTNAMRRNSLETVRQFSWEQYYKRWSDLVDIF